MTKIQWAQSTWNPIVGCSIPMLPSTGKPRSGCLHCYACKDSPHRFAKVYDKPGVVVLRGKAKRPGMTFVPKSPDGKSLGKGAQWTGEIRLLPWSLDVPLRREKSTTYFVNSLSDLFHENLVDCGEGRRFIAAIFGVMAACPQHTFQILTKRPHKAREWFAWLVQWVGTAHILTTNDVLCGYVRSMIPDLSDRIVLGSLANNSWPLPNVWIGTSVEDQASADWAIPELLRVPAALRFLSVEPLLGPVDMDSSLGGTRWIGGQRGCGHKGRDRTHHHDDRCADGISWIIVGGESGSGARECEVDWIRSIVAQCKAAEVPVFVKQLGARSVGLWTDGEAFAFDLADKKGGNIKEWPEDLRVREMPT